jgi:plasmid maintenance system antidote protein VapI
LKRFACPFAGKNSLFQWKSEYYVCVCLTLCLVLKVHYYCEIHYLCEFDLKHNLYLKMQLHPGKKIQVELKDRGWTQRQFAFLLWKKVSEVNELIKWKRNITVQRDILLSHVLWTSRKYRLDLQNEYEYSLIESDFDISKLPNVDQKVASSNKNKQKISEQENNPEINLEKIKQSSDKTLSEEKKEVKPASQQDEDFNKQHKTDKDIDISNQQIKHQNPDSKKDQNIKKNDEKNITSNQKLSTLNSDHKITSSEWHKKLQDQKDKYDRQKNYNPNHKFDSYFPSKDKKLEHKNHSKSIPPKQDLSTLNSSHKTTSPELQKKWEEKKEDHKDHHKHKEHIFRNF